MENLFFCEERRREGLTSNRGLTFSIVSIRVGHRDAVVKLYHLLDTQSWVCASKENNFPRRGKKGKGIDST